VTMSNGALALSLRLSLGEPSLSYGGEPPVNLNCHEPRAVTVKKNLRFSSLSAPRAVRE
jgi:hypothetical protein